MKKSERDAQVKALQAEAEKLRTKIYDLQNSEVEDDPISFVGCNVDIANIHRFINSGAKKTFWFRMREQGNYTGIGVFLGVGPICDWKIVRDSDNCWVLIPTINEIVKAKPAPRKRASSKASNIVDFEQEEGDA